MLEIVQMKTVTPNQRAKMARQLVFNMIEVLSSPGFFDAYEALTKSKVYPLSAETFSGKIFDTVLEPGGNGVNSPSQYSKPERERIAQAAFQMMKGIMGEGKK
jgi:hypothetical protein